MDPNVFDWMINEIQEWSFRSEDWFLIHYSSLLTVMILKIKKIGSLFKRGWKRLITVISKKKG